MFGNAYQVTCLKEEYKVIVAVKGDGKTQTQDWKSFGSHSTEQFKSKVFKGKQAEWEDNEFSDIAEDIKFVTSNKPSK